MKKVVLIPISTIPLIKSGDQLAEIILASCETEKVALKDGDIIVIAQKIVSKAENAVVDLKSITPTEKALEIAAQTGRDPRLVQVYLNESTEVLYLKGRAVITRHRSGLIMSGSGVDRSNVAEHSQEIVILLPKDSDRSAQIIRESVYRIKKKRVAVIVNDSGGRNDRAGSVGMAIGLAGIGAIETRAQRDLYGNPTNSQIALVDELASAGSILMGQANESIPVVIIRGVDYTVVEKTCIANILN